MRRADRYLAADGTTQFRVGTDALIVADTVIPFRQITCIYFNVEKRQFSDAGKRPRGDRPVATETIRVQICRRLPSPHAVPVVVTLRLRSSTEMLSHHARQIAPMTKTVATDHTTARIQDVMPPRTRGRTVDQECLTNQ